MAQREAVEALVAHEQGVTWQLETVYLDVESLQPDEVIVDMVRSLLHR